MSETLPDEQALSLSPAIPDAPEADPADVVEQETPAAAADDPVSALPFGGLPAPVTDSDPLESAGEFDRIDQAIEVPLDEEDGR